MENFVNPFEIKIGQTPNRKHYLLIHIVRPVDLRQPRRVFEYFAIEESIQADGDVNHGPKPTEGLKKEVHGTKVASKTCDCFTVSGVVCSFTNPGITIRITRFFLFHATIQAILSLLCSDAMITM